MPQTRFHPADAAPGKLIMVLHGRGDSMDGFTWLPEALALPGVAYMFVNAPDDYFGGYSWYDLPPDQGPGILRSRALLAGLLDDLVGRGWKSEDVAIFGFSQGCLMAIDVGARYPRRLAGVCGISGYVFFADELQTETAAHAREMPWWVSAGTQDHVVPYALTAEGVEAMRDAGLAVEWHAYQKGHTIDPERELPDVRTWLAKVLA
ncbi:MAG: serine esterase [Cyanobacteria bacterium RYN_339]|nr:serine esterase [Cyanobacteria bacterium RYN_339]